MRIAHRAKGGRHDDRLRQQLLTVRAQDPWLHRREGPARRAHSGDAARSLVEIPRLPPDPSSKSRACTPIGKIPPFQAGDSRLADSSATCHYLERKYPSPALFPASVEDFGRMMWFEEFNDTVLVPTAGKVFFQLVVRPSLLTEQPD